MGRAPVIGHMIGLKRIAHAMDQIGFKGRSVQGRRGKGQQPGRHSFFGLNEFLCLFPAFGIFQVALYFPFIQLFPAEHVFCVGTPQLILCCQKDVSPLSGCGHIVAKGIGP